MKMGDKEPQMVNEEGKNSQSNIMVVVRTRPLNQKEIVKSDYEIIKVTDQKIVTLLDPSYENNQQDILRKNRNKDAQFTFDFAFDKNTEQSEIYKKSTAFLVKGVFEGYNGTVFAYGATGAGKSYTMIGTSDNAGIMQRSMDDLFRIYEQQSLIKDISVKVSYIEIYNEQIKDLLATNDRNLEIREDQQQGVIILGLTELLVKNSSEILHLLKLGNKNRAIESTGANEVSSRSHAVLQVQLQFKDKSGKPNQQTQNAKLSLVDLAGSERVANTQNKGIRLVEGAKINQSLLALGNCIQALSDANEKGKNIFVSYRASKLTRLLKDSLGGNCRTVMIANVSPCIYSYDDTYNTLNYANRAKNIKTQIQKCNINLNNQNYIQIIDNLKKENENLKIMIQNRYLTLPSLDFGFTQKQEITKQETISQIETNVDQKFKEEQKLKRNIFQLDEKIQEIQFEQFKLLKQSKTIQEETSESSLIKEKVCMNQQLINTLQTSKTDMEKSLNLIQQNSQQNSLFDSQEQQIIIKDRDGLAEEEKQNLIKSINEFQLWLRQYLKESQFLELIQQLRQKWSFNINDMLCVESVNNSDSQQWSQTLQVPIEQLKKYINTLMDFNKYTGMVTGQFDLDLKCKNEQLNTQIYILKEEAVKKETKLLEQRNQIIDELKEKSQISIDQKDQIIEELKSLIDQYILEKSKCLNSQELMEEESHKKEDTIFNLNEQILNLKNDIKKMKQGTNFSNLELKEINENLLKMQEQSEEQIKKLQNEIDCLYMQNFSLQEELASEQQRYFIEKDDSQQQLEQFQSLEHTVKYQSQIIEDLQFEIQQERKQMSLLYENFSIEKELPNNLPFNSLWKYIQNLIFDFQSEKVQKENLIDQVHQLCQQEQSKHRVNSELIHLKTPIFSKDKNISLLNKQMIPSQKNSKEKGLKESNQMDRILNKSLLQEKYTQYDQYLNNLNFEREFFENNSSSEIKTIDKFKDTFKKSPSQFEFNSVKSKSKCSSSAIQLLQSKINESQRYENKSIEVIKQLIGENKTFCQALIEKIDEIDKLKKDIKNSYETQYQMKQEITNEFIKLQEQSKENQNKLYQQLSQIVQFEIIKQSLEEKVNSLSEENQYLKQLQADNLQSIEKLTKEKDFIEDSSFFYELQSKKFQEKLKSLSKQSEENQGRLKEINIPSYSNQKQFSYSEKGPTIQKQFTIQSSEQQKKNPIKQQQIKNQYNLYQNQIIQYQNQSNSSTSNQNNSTNIISENQKQQVKQNLNLLFSALSPENKYQTNKKEAKQQIHLNQQQINNSLIQNSISKIKEIELENKKSKQKRDQSPSILSSQNSPQYLKLDPETNNKKRTFLHILDEIEENDSEHKISQMDLYKTLIPLQNKKEMEVNHDDDDDEDDEQDLINLKETIYKIHFKEQNKKQFP